MFAYAFVVGNLPIASGQVLKAGADAGEPVQDFAHDSVVTCHISVALCTPGEVGFYVHGL
jgi:hypothetical protein